MASRLREAVLDEQVKDLESRLDDSEKKLVANSKDRQLQLAQNEVIKFSTRYAESQETVRDLQTRLEKLEASWMQMQSRNILGSSASSTHYGNGIGIAGTPNEHSLTRETALERELMAIRLQEAKTTALAKDQKMKILELEQWCEHLSKQMTRTEDERADLRFRVQEMEKEKINLENYY